MAFFIRPAFYTKLRTQLLDQVKARWIVIKDNLADIDPSERFLYHYWTSLHGRTSKNRLFRLMRGEITSAKSALSFAVKLSEAAKLYAALNIPGHPHWNNYDQRTKDNLEVLNLLDAQQALPILLAAADEFSEDEFSKLTEVLLTMAVRYNLIGELRTGVAANYYSEIPPKIRAGKLTKSAKVFRELKPIYPNDEEFRSSFAKKVLRNSSKARYLLGQLEKYLHDDKSEVVGDTKKVNLEHILPKNPSQHWKDIISRIDPDEFDEYVYRLGNIALVSSATNKKLGSKGFEAKKQQLFSVEKHFELTRLIEEYNDWTTQSIIDRQEKLAEVAIKVWRVDID